MSGIGPNRKHQWTLSIVLVICGLMVLPGAAFVASAAAQGSSSTGSSAALAPGVAGPSGSYPSLHAPSLAPTSSANSNYGPAAFSSNLPSSPASPSSSSPVVSPPLVSSLPSDLNNAPWAQSLLQPGYHTPLASLPILELLEHPVISVNGQISPYYVAQPAPLGLTDFGLGAQTYAYNTSHIAGTVTFNSPPNETQPGGYEMVEPSPNGAHLGYVGNLYEFGIQLNTVGINLTIPGTSDLGQVWAQNVVNWNDTGIHFVMDTWNASAGSGFYMAPNSIYSGCNNNTQGANYILDFYGGVFQCVKGNIPISAADYPISITLYNNFTVNAQNRSELVYGYSLDEVGAGKVMGGVVDTVVFNNTAPSWQAPAMPVNSPANSINGFTANPYGLDYDAEIVLCGGIGGDNSVFRAANGTMTLQYSNLTSGGWQNVPSAYNFGGDTGETATGIADYWTSSDTLVFHQGPTMLYGLWNSEPQVAVPSGAVHIAGTLSPSYGFVFVSNTPPVTNPFGAVPEQDNMSWLPTNDAGAFDTYLPAFGGAWTSTYYIQSFADGFAEDNTSITAATTTLAIDLTSAPGTLNAPLYMFSDAQAASLAANVSGLPVSTGGPYNFSGLSVDVNFTFDHINDWTFPTFEVFHAQNVQGPINVNNVYLGTDTGPDAFFNSYIYDTAFGSTGILTPVPAVILGVPYYTSGIEIFSGTGATVSEQTIFDVYLNAPGGSMLILWNDANAQVENTTAFDPLFGGSSYGVFVGDSTGTRVVNTYAAYGYGVTDIGSIGTTVWNLTADDALGIQALSATGSTYSWINATDYAEGIGAGMDFGFSYYYDLPGTIDVTVNDLNVSYGGYGANFTFSQGTTFNNVVVNDTYYESIGILLDGVTGTTVNDMSIDEGNLGIMAWNATGTVVTGFTAVSVGYFGILIGSSAETTLNDLILTDDYAGVYGESDTATVVSGATITGDYGGIVMADSSGFSATNLNSTDTYYATELAYSTGPITVTGINANADNIGLNLYETGPATVQNVAINDSYDFCYDYYYCAGVTVDGGTGVSVGHLTATNDSLGVLFIDGASMGTASAIVADSSEGVEIDASSSITVSGVTATDGSLGIGVDWNTGGMSTDLTISGVVASDYSLGDIVYTSTGVTISGSTASSWSLADAIFESTQVVDTGATVTGGNSTGVYVAGSYQVTVSDVTATASSLTPLYAGNYLSASGLPFGAVVTESDSAVSVAGVTALHYGAGMIDFGSDGLAVSDLNATGGQYAIVLNGTYNSLFSGIGAYEDWQGALLQDGASGNTLMSSSFVADTSYGVYIASGSGNTVWNNNFAGDNGATATYSAAHIQAWSVPGNDFNICTSGSCATGIGNYWADWHTYGPNGFLAPYPVTGSVYDMFPIGPAESFAVTFSESGLASGTNWSVTVNGVTQWTTGSSLVFQLADGTYTYAFGSVGGYTLTGGSGSVTVAGQPMSVSATYTPVPTYTVTFTESGVPAGSSWSVTFNGVSSSSNTSAIAFTVPAGTYDYQVGSVAGYSVSPASGAVTIGGNYAVAVTYSQTVYAVTVSEGGLASGTTWSATVNGVTQSTSGTSLTFYLPSGSYSYSFASVHGYSVTNGSGTVTVSGAAASVAASYSSTASPPSYASTSSLNTYFAVGIVLAIIAIVIALIALFRRPPRSEPVAAWKEGTTGGSTPEPEEKST